MRPRTFLIFSGFNDRAVFALIRGMEACSANYVVIARSNDDPVLQSSHGHRVCLVRNRDELTLEAFEELIAEVRKQVGHDILIVVPTSEYLNSFLVSLDRDDVLNRLGCEVPLVDGDLYFGLSNKLSSSELFSAAGIRVPNHLERFDYAHLPLVAKPVQNIGNDGVSRYPIILSTADDLETFLGRPDAGSYFAQQFISGTSEYVLAYIARSGETFVSSQSNIAQQPHGKSIVLARTSNFHTDPMARRAVSLLRSLHFYGFVMLEFIVDADGPCFIELNPRAWGPLQLCLDHACGIVEAFIGDNLANDPLRYENVWKDKPRQARYLWFGGMIATRGRRERLKWSVSSASSRIAQVVTSLGSDVYLRHDTWKVFAREGLRQ